MDIDPFQIISSLGYRLRNRKVFFIIAYHNIISNHNDDYDFDIENVSCDQHKFEEQVVFFSKYFTVVTYSQLSLELEKYSYLKPPLVITFDDGYESFYSLAAPILKKHNCPATIFISTDQIGTDNLFWWDEVAFFCKKLTPLKFFQDFFAEFFIADTNLKYFLNENNYLEFHRSLLFYLKNQDDEIIGGFIKFIREKTKDLISFSSIDISPVKLMSWPQVQESSRYGFEFGSHTLSHCRLDYCKEEKIEKEISLSCVRIFQELSVKPETFCFPGGKRGQQVLRINNILSGNRIKYACTMEFGVNDQYSHQYSHKRIAIDRNVTLTQLKKFLYFSGLRSQYLNIKNCLFLASGTVEKLKAAGNILINKSPKKYRDHTAPKHIFIAICDHFEPYWHKASHTQAKNRVKMWFDNLPRIFSKHQDSDKRCPKYDFFYPHEEYNRELLNMLSDLCLHGFGEVNIHLHHDCDTSSNLKRTLIDYKNRLAEDHNLLCNDSLTCDIAYGFIHGNWALDNSSPDGRWCGVNNELEILKQTGCFADFTMPSAPDSTQTRKINSIYYAADVPDKPKSHDRGIDAEEGRQNKTDLLLIQGPLSLQLRNFRLKIENGELQGDNPPTPKRIDSWVRQAIAVKGRENWIFVKLHTHGTQEDTMNMFFKQGYLDSMLTDLETRYNEGNKYLLHYVTAREMVNVIHAIEAGEKEWRPDLLDYRYKLNNR